MTQTALNEKVVIQADVWTLISEVNCTFVVEQGTAELLGMSGAAPAADATGITYRKGEGEEAATDMLSRFTGAGIADRLYMISRGTHAVVFVSRAAVA